MKYDSIKKDLKKKNANHKMYVQGTGGGEQRPSPKPYCEEENQLLATISVAVEGLNSETDSDALHGIPIEEEPEEPLVQEIEDVVVEWTPPSTKLLRTPVHEALQPKKVMTSGRAEVQEHNCAGSSKDWSQRRRPILKRKRKPTSSVAAKFEELAEQKLKLVQLQLASVEEARQQQQLEHSMRMRNLKLQNTILRNKAKQQAKTQLFNSFF
ncbi:unnamed protein product [Callosobruchus maculatus]|uniref:Uncharacterized protein n=1 Tax=Callosobruchus maculatus TaxID=64391 RepID=A0A653DAT6_CALMS|nr:unnamed protein product [Callosobruchus maculatus]